MLHPAIDGQGGLTGQMRPEFRPCAPHPTQAEFALVAIGHHNQKRLDPLCEDQSACVRAGRDGRIQTGS